MDTDLNASLGMLNSTIQNASNVYLTAKSKKEDRKFAERMYNKQVQDNRRNWELANEYNLPSAQVQRLKDANLNPYLMYGNGASGLVSQSVQSASPSVSYSRAPQFDTQVAFGNALLRAQIANLNAQTEKIQTESDLNRSRTSGQDISNYIQGKSKDFYVKLASMAPDKNQAEIDQIKSAANLNESSAATSIVSRNLMQAQAEQLGALVRNLDANTALTKEQKKYVSYNAFTARMNAETNRLEYKLNASLLPYQMSLMQAQLNLTNQQAGLVFKSIGKVAAETNGVITDNAIKKLQETWRNTYGFSDGLVQGLINYFDWISATPVQKHSGSKSDQYTKK